MFTVHEWLNRFWTVLFLLDQERFITEQLFKTPTQFLAVLTWISPENQIIAFPVYYTLIKIYKKNEHGKLEQVQKYSTQEQRQGKKFKLGLIGKDWRWLGLLSLEECSHRMSGTVIAYKHWKGSNKRFTFYINITVYKALPDQLFYWFLTAVFQSRSRHTFSVKKKKEKVRWLNRFGFADRVISVALSPWSPCHLCCNSAGKQPWAVTKHMVMTVSQ